jgi:hypothetical protein
MGKNSDVNDQNGSNDEKVEPNSATKLDLEQAVAPKNLEIEETTKKPEETTEGDSKKESKSCKDWLRETFIDDKWFWLIIVVLLLACIGICRSLPVGIWFGFTLSAYSAIANDSIQTLGTFIASNKDVAWWKQWIWIALIFNVTTLYSWFMYEGDITHERLKSKGFDTPPTELNYLQVSAPVVLLILTRLRIPVSTTFMILTVFVTKPKALGKTIVKSLSGYGISFLLAAIIYLPLSKFVSDYCDKTRGKLSAWWTPVQWLTTGVLWSVWLMQDMSNIAVYLPRALNWGELLAVCLVTTAGLAYQLKMGGEKIQRVVDEKSRVKDIPEATLINFLFAIVLFVFKIVSKIPMSTTWCFVGLLAGREISMAIRKAANRTFK